MPAWIFPEREFLEHRFPEQIYPDFFFLEWKIPQKSLQIALLNNGCILSILYNVQLYCYIGLQNLIITRLTSSLISLYIKSLYNYKSFLDLVLICIRFFITFLIKLLGYINPEQWFLTLFALQTLKLTKCTTGGPLNTC